MKYIWTFQNDPRQNLNFVFHYIFLSPFFMTFQNSATCIKWFFGSYWGFSVFVSNFSAVSRLPELMVKGMVGRHIQLTINSQSSVNLDTWEKVFKLKQFSYIHYKGVNSCCKCGVYKGVNSCCKCSEVNDLNNLTTHVPQVMLLFFW